MDALYLARARELARRGVGGTAPNPPVGALIVRDGRTLGEGFHRERGAPHAEVEALTDARRRGHDVRGATMFVTLEPCNHHGATPPCTDAVLEAGFSRIVIGAADPNPKTAGSGIARLRETGIDVVVEDDALSRELIEPFSVWVRSTRPFVTLKMAASIDGYVAPEPGSHWLTGPASRERVRELREQHDAVMVGAGTIRVDDPQLTVRPPHARRKPYVRVVGCEDAPVPASSRVFQASPGYARTIVLAPAAARAQFASLENVADCRYIEESERLDLPAALRNLKESGISSVLCEGGPTLASALLGRRLVDRVIWILAPVFLASERAVPALARGQTWLGAWKFESAERVGEDLWLTAKPGSNV